MTSLQMNRHYIQQQVRASAGENGSDGALNNNAQEKIVPRFHWTMVVPYVYTTLLLYMSTLQGYFSLSGAAFFFLFLLHSYAYYGFRSK